MSKWLGFWVGCSLPCLAQSHVYDSAVFAEGDVDVAEGIESATIETDILFESFEDKSALVERWLRFSRHSCALRKSS